MKSSIRTILNQAISSILTPLHPVPPVWTVFPRPEKVRPTIEAEIRRLPASKIRLGYSRVDDYSYPFIEQDPHSVFPRPGVIIESAQFKEDEIEDEFPIV